MNDTVRVRNTTRPRAAGYTTSLNSRVRYSWRDFRCLRRRLPWRIVCGHSGSGRGSSCGHGRLRDDATFDLSLNGAVRCNERRCKSKRLALFSARRIGPPSHEIVAMPQDSMLRKRVVASKPRPNYLPHAVPPVGLTLALQPGASAGRRHHRQPMIHAALAVGCKHRMGSWSSLSRSCLRTEDFTREPRKISCLAPAMLSLWATRHRDPR